MVTLAIWLVRCAAAVIVVIVGITLAVLAYAKQEDLAWGAAFSLITIAGGLLSFPRRPGAWKRDPPTDRQVAFAENLGIIVPDGVTKGELSAMITQVTGR